MQSAKKEERQFFNEMGDEHICLWENIIELQLYYDHVHIFLFLVSDIGHLCAIDAI